MALNELKNYEIGVNAYAIVVVTGAKNEHEALESLSKYLDWGDLKVDEIEIQGELKTKAELDKSKGFAHKVICL